MDLCFSPALNRPLINSLFFEEYTKFEEMQKSIPALMEATEMMIQHVDIITMLPNSFLQQLRQYNQEEGHNDQHKVFTKVIYSRS